MFELLFYIGLICLLLGVIVPIIILIYYPFYKYLGGRSNLIDYFRNF